MAKGMFIGDTNNKARKVTKAYVGMGGTARKVKAAYIGFNGAARQVYSAEKKVVYVGGITSLSTGSHTLAAASNSSYALFGGGVSTDRVDAYNASLTRSTPTPLSSARSALAATSNGSYVLFGGGITNSQAKTNEVDAYSLSLTRSTPTGLNTSRLSLAAAYNGTYMIFGGGEAPTTNAVDAYSSSLVRTSTATLSSARDGLSAGRAGNYALFCGGYDSSAIATNIVDVFNSSLTRSTIGGLDGNSAYGAAASIGTSMIHGGGFAGGWGSYTLHPSMTGYDSSLTRFFPTGLSYARGHLAASGTSTHAYFGGGSSALNTGEGTIYSVVDVFNASFTRITQVSLSTARARLASTTNNSETVLFAGGYGGTGAGSAVEGFTFA